jgi:hypothetical protein
VVWRVALPVLGVLGQPEERSLVRVSVKVVKEFGADP